MKKSLKKSLGVIGATLALGLVLAGCSNSSSSDNSVKKIQDKGTLVVGTSADYAPFEFPIVKNGKKQIVGYDMLIAQKIAKDLNVKLKIENTEFSSLISELKSNKIDLILAGMVSTDQRKKAVAFSKSYYEVENVLLVQKKDADKYKSISSLKGKQVGAQQSTTQQEIGQTQLKNSNLVTESLVTSLTTELSEGKLDGVIVENEIANNYLKQYPNKYAIAKVKLTTPKQYRQVNVALRKGDKGLLKRVNKEITKLQKSGEMTKLFKKAEKIQTEYSK
ncbi:transporter substrate-binding domain-containing protein [Liquorilactobacillus cacaonum]|uniref:ABC transporter substrate-binding protein n=1 Tax=Liquorilactobacillus cacaonum DSM 21116 TaxID=1423729 RepID=A0A0R2CVL0_9LACO|nr:transporter substrate-binding domain-containing protein [Liquorilactobacillus cacaonum]KRM91926.1 ABC transporter substrate-binding protein [Liquorilactobacillus cacaonum DSM 21116]